MKRNLKPFDKLVKFKSWQFWRWRITLSIYNTTDHFLSDAEENILLHDSWSVNTITPEQIATAVGKVEPTLAYQKEVL